MKKIIKRIKGFTLTELIIVIAIIGILAAVLIPSITGYIKKANISADKQEVTNMNQAYQLYLSENDLMNADMEASDVRNIVLQTGDYSFKTRVKDYAIWYSNDSKKIYYGKVADGVEAAGGSGKLEDINQNGKLLISTGGSKAAEALYAIRNLKSESEFETLVNTAKAFTDAQKTYLTTNFSTDKVLYVGESNSIFTQNGFYTNIPEQVIFSDNVQVLSEGQITNVTKITKLSVPVSLLYLGAGAFKDITIDKIELKNPDTFIETGCFNSTTLSKNVLIKEQDSATLSKSNILCYVTFSSTTTGDPVYTYTEYKNGFMTCKYINFKGIQFNRTSTGAKRCLVQSKINGNVIEYNYFELNGMGIVAKETFTYLREVVLTTHYKDTESGGGNFDPYVERTVDGYQFTLSELSYKTSSADTATYKVQIKYGTAENFAEITKVSTVGSVDYGKYVYTPKDFSKETKYTLQVLYGSVVIYEMVFEKTSS